MATPTSSSNRSKRKSSQPVTKGQNPQRANRQKVSNAKVTNDGGRGSNAGSAKVTTGRGASAPKPADPWKAPTTKNSRTSAPKSNTTFRTQNTPLTLPNSRAQGKNLPRAGAQQLRSTTQGPRPSGKPPVKPSGNFKAPSIPKPSTSASKPSTAARTSRGLVGKGSIAAMALGAANAADNARLTPAQLRKKYEVVNPDRGQNLLTKFQSGTLGQPNKPKPKQGNAQSRFAGARDRNLQRINSDPRFAAPKEKPKPPAPPKNPPAPAADQRRPGGGNNTAPRSQTPPAPRFTGTVDEGRQKWAEKYSSSKYDGQAIQKEAKKLLDEMKKRKEDKSNATKAGWDGNKNY